MAVAHAQGAPGTEKKDRGSIFLEMSSGHGLTKYVSGRLSKYGNGVSIFFLFFLFFFIFFNFDYRAPRGTEPHVALHNWEGTRNVTRTSVNGLWLCKSPLSCKLTLRNTDYITANEYNYVAPKDRALCGGKCLAI